MTRGSLFFLCLSLAFYSVVGVGKSYAQLVKGNLVLLGINPNNNDCNGPLPEGDLIILATLVDLPAGTKFMITDNGFQRSDACNGTWGNTEGVIKFTVPTGMTVPAGTVFRFFVKTASPQTITQLNHTTTYLLNADIVHGPFNITASVPDNFDQVSIIAGDNWMNGTAGQNDATTSGEVLFAINNHYLWDICPPLQTNLQGSSDSDGELCYKVTHFESILDPPLPSIGQGRYFIYNGPLTSANYYTWVTRFLLPVCNWQGFTNCTGFNGVPTANTDQISITPFTDGLSCVAGCHNCTPANTTVQFSLPAVSNCLTGPIPTSISFEATLSNGQTFSGLTHTNNTRNLTLNSTTNLTITNFKVVYNVLGVPTYSCPLIGYPGQELIQVTGPTPPTANAGPNQTYSSVQTVTLNGSIGGSSTTGTWQIASGPMGTFGDPNQPVTTFTPSGPGVYVLQLSGDDPDGPTGPCAAPTSNVTLTFNSAPPPTVVSGRRCGPGSVLLSASGCSGTIEWFDNNIGGSPLASGDNFNTPGISASTIYYAGCNINGALSQLAPVLAVVHPDPIDPILASTATNICTGTPVTFTANLPAGAVNHTYRYQFFKNGTPLGPPSLSSTITLNNLNNGDQISVRTHKLVAYNGLTPPFTGNGDFNFWPSILSFATAEKNPSAPLGFGSEHRINGLKITGVGDSIYILLAGRVANNNRIMLFIDSKPGGYNNGNYGRNGAPWAAGTFNSGTIFDPGFFADYVLAIGTNIGENNYFFDLYTLSGTASNLASGGPNNYLGDDNDITKPFGVNEVSNIPTIFERDKGFEMGFAKSALGYTGGDLKIFALYSADNGTINSQFLTEAGASEGIYGSGPINFANAAPNPMVFPQVLLEDDCVGESNIITINVESPPTLTLTPQNIICSGTGGINLTLNGGQGPFTFDWSHNGPQDPDTDPQNLTGVGVGTYTVTVTSNLCTTTASASVVIAPNTPPVVSCQPLSINLNTAGTGTLNATDIFIGYSDDCSTTYSSIGVSPSNFNCTHVGAGSPITGDLLISEYIESFGNEKYIEIYNAGNTTVNLGNYQIRLYSNGSSTPTTISTLSGTLAPGATAVYKNAGASGPGTSLTAVNFNGNDALELYNALTNKPADILGRIGEDPGLFWSAANGNTTQNVILRRKPNVNIGVKSNPAAGFPTLGQQWNNITPITDLSGLGSHAINPVINGQHVVLTVTDNAGATGTCTASVVVLDVTPPTLSCATTLSANYPASGSVSFTVNNVVSNVTDVCSTPTTTISPNSFSCAGITTTGATSLFISEYYMGVENNDRYIEVFNGTGSSINLANFQIRTYFNGSLTPGQTATLSGTLAPGQTQVFRRPISSGTQLYPGALPLGTASNTPLSYNGNDAIELWHIPSSTPVDIIGTIGENPGTSWFAVNGSNTFRSSLRRRPTIKQGNVTNAPGFPSLATEWFWYPVTTSNNQISNLGSHLFNSSQANTTLVVTSTDGSGNATSCTVSVSVSDNTPPTIICPANVNTSTTGGQCGASGVDIGSPTLSDNCTPPANYTITPAPPVLFPLGTTTLTYVASDAQGNTAACTQNITVTDPQPPVIVCPPPLIVNTNTGCTATGLVLGNATATDNCTPPLPSVSILTPPPTAFPLGQTTLIYQATDQFGNTSTCTQTVTVNDNQPPVINCTNFTDVIVSGGVYQVDPADLISTISDCSTFTLSAQPSNLTCAHLGNNIITLTATDIQNNSSTCQATLTLTGAATASITPANVQLTCLNNSAVLTATGGITYIWSNGNTTPSITVTGFGVYTVTVTAANGCTATSLAGVAEDLTISPPNANHAQHCTGALPKSVSPTGCAAGTLLWYTSPTGGTPIFTGNTFTPGISNTTTYYVACQIGSCISTRTAVTWFFYPPISPAITASTLDICEADEVTITATPLPSSAPAGTSFQYEFFLNGISVQGPGPSHIFTYTPSNNDSVTVKVYYDF